MKVKKLTLLAALLNVVSVSHAGDFNYNYVELSLGQAESDSAEADAVSLSGSVQLQNGVLLGLGYGNIEYKEVLGINLNSVGVDFEVNLLSAGVGYAVQLDANSSAYMGVVLSTGETDSNVSVLDGEDVDQLGVAAGARYWLSPDTFELFGSLGWARTEIADEDDSGFRLGFGIRAHLNELLALGLSFDRSFDDEDVDTVAFQARMQF